MSFKRSSVCNKCFYLSLNVYKCHGRFSFMSEDLICFALSYVLNCGGFVLRERFYLMGFPYMDLVVYGYVNGVSTLIGGACYLRVTFSTEMSQKECCDTKKAWCNFLILNDSTCQFYYKVNICVKPYKKSCRGVT